MNLERLTSVAQGVARAHIEPLGYTFSVKPYYSDGLIIEASFGDERHLEHLLLGRMSDAVQEEYVHCRVHALAAKLIARRYPA